MLSEKFSKILLVVGIVMLCIIPFSFLWNEWESLSWTSKIQSDKFGQFGDLVGGFVGAIWGLAVVILFYVALTEQRRDFKTNREVLNKQTEALEQQINEFEPQREELSETRKVFKMQSETLKIQQLEEIFAIIEYSDLETLPITRKHILKSSKLLFHHRDSFDRLIIAQADCEKLTVITKDEQFLNYEIKTEWK